jgi:hypothetical protein
MEGYFCVYQNEHENVRKNHWAWTCRNDNYEVEIDVINIIVDKYQLCASFMSNNTRLLIESNKNGDEIKDTILIIPELDFFFRIKTEEDFMNKVKSLLLFM